MADPKTRVLISSLPSRPEGEVGLAGWVVKVRDQKKVQFVILRDESGQDLQLVHVRGEDDSLAKTISELSLGSFVRVAGRLRHDERVKLSGLEVEILEFEVVSVADPESPVAADSSIDKRLDWRFLDLRQSPNNLIVRVQSAFLQALRQWWTGEGFIEIHTPKLMASPSESRAELFSLPYFDQTAYLAQSPQFYKQMAQAAGLGRVFEIAPVYRADPSFTSRHATEFTGVDAEMSWIDSHLEVMDMQEALLHHALTRVAEEYGRQIRAVFGREVIVPESFVRITLAEALEISASAGHKSERADGDLDPEAERRVGAWARAEHNSELVFVTDYPTNLRPFYHMRYRAGRLTKSYDLLWSGVEVTTGAQREHRLEVLVDQARQKGLDPAEMSCYLDFFKYGCPPHGGFGAGLARMLMMLLGLESVREVMFLFRGPNRLTP